MYHKIIDGPQLNVHTLNFQVFHECRFEKAIIYFSSMNPMIVAALALVAVTSVAEATIFIGVVGVGVSVTASASTVATLGLLGGVALLKGLVLGSLLSRPRHSYRHSYRHKRSANPESESDAAFAILTNSEPAQCYRRLICDMAAGAIPDQDKILSLFDKEVSPVSPKFEYVTAAKVGKIMKTSGLCELRYTCPLNTQEIATLFN